MSFSQVADLESVGQSQDLGHRLLGQAILLLDTIAAETSAVFDRWPLSRHQPTSKMRKPSQLLGRGLRDAQCWARPRQLQVLTTAEGEVWTIQLPSKLSHSLACSCDLVVRAKLRHAEGRVHGASNDWALSRDFLFSLSDSHVPTFPSWAVQSNTTCLCGAFCACQSTRGPS